jgi:hypothetical protein
MRVLLCILNAVFFRIVYKPIHLRLILFRALQAGGRTEREGGQHPLPPGWGSAIDPETGAEYFFEWGKGEFIEHINFF